MCRIPSQGVTMTRAMKTSVHTAASIALVVVACSDPPPNVA